VRAFETTSSSPPPPTEAGKRVLARRRALAVASALVVPSACVAVDLAVRGHDLPRALWPTYAAGAASSLIVWSLAAEAARHPSRPVRAVALAFVGVTAACGLGLQATVRALTHAYLGRRALLLAVGMTSLTKSSYFARYAVAIAAVCAIPAALVVALTVARTRRVGLSAGALRAVPVVLAAALFGVMFAPFEAQGLQGLPPDILWLHGLGGPVLYAVGRASRPKALPVGHHEALPRSGALPGVPVVLILAESLRRDVMCSARSPGCASSPRLDQAAPDRVGYARAFSTATCTELASTALWTGLAVTTPMDALARAPLVWDWAKAHGYRTAYLTSQNLLFQQSDQFLRGSAIDLLREARDEVVDAPIDDGSPDEAVTAHAIAFLEAPGPPPLLVVHHANTHFPYRQPRERAAESDDALERYRASVVRNDAMLADLVTRIRATDVGRRAVIVYTSDHGEAFGEHGGSYHSFDLYAEQLNVPLWIDAPAGALPPEALARLRREAGTRSVVVSDVAATVVDLLGGLDDPALRGHAAALAGTSLLREAPVDRDVLMWNCPPMRECAAEAFGVVRYPLKLQWVGHDHRYACHDEAADPEERVALPAERCAALFPVLDAAFGARPREE
jgi:glucan phosphoethanolaminetransferase (alkaline phosphatase superfamily)